MGSYLPLPWTPPVAKSPAEKALSDAPSAVVTDVMLQWIFAKVGDTQEIVTDIDDFYPCLGQSKIEAARVRLAQRGLIEQSWAYVGELNNQFLG